jgi:hypothetical protein
MRGKERFIGCLVTMLLGATAFAQQNVSITLSLIDPANVEYQMVVVNNNPASPGWAVDQLHVLYTTANVLQATQVPSGWGIFPDVPWDAIPKALRFEANTAGDRIPPNGGSRTFRFKMNTKTPAEDFYIQFRVVQGSQSQEYVKRVKILGTLNVPADSAQSQQLNVPTPSGGMQQLFRLRFRADFVVPTLRYDIATTDQDGLARDQVQYPPAPIRQPPHLEHFFLGSVERNIDAEGVIPGSYWSLCHESAQWNGDAVGISNLRWERDIGTMARPTACWQFFPSLRLPDGQRLVRFRITNCGTIPFQGTLQLYLRGDRLLSCGPELTGWTEQFPADFIEQIALPVGASRSFTLLIPADVPRNRFFYGALDMQFGHDELPGLLFFAHQEVERPLLIGLLQHDGSRRPVEVIVSNPFSAFSSTFSLIADADGVWRAQLDAASGPAFYNDPGFYLPLWQVRVKPRGALSQTFRQVLVPGGDTLDPYLRMALILGDVNGDDCIDDADLLMVLFAFGQTGDLPEDLNMDGVVDDADLLIVLFNFGSGC